MYFSFVQQFACLFFLLFLLSWSLSVVTVTAAAAAANDEDVADVSFTVNMWRVFNDGKKLST